MIRVAFQGERGAFSEEAAIRLLGPDIELVPTRTFDALFAALPKGEADKVLAPVENTLAGSIDRTHDLLLESGLSIEAEVVIPIIHCLLGYPGATFGGLRTVESHPVALAQCERFFAQHPGLTRVVADDTAGSVKSVMERKDPTRAAIASRRAAEVYGAQVLREHLEDHAENFTRFVLVGPRRPPSPESDKLSLVVTLPHTPGALFQALEPFARRKVNLLKLESRPLVGRPFHYRFYLDLGAKPGDPAAAQALDELRARAEDVRELGWYPSGVRP
jgi:prephenate dehydratase